jgi:hypothetical protein
MAGPGFQKAFAAALIDPTAPPPAGLTTARGAPDPKCLAVYRNNVIAGLGKALERRFPVTQRLVGDEFFRGMARAFIATCMPGSPLMAEYGDELPGFIERSEALASVPYLADVARLEALWTRAYHAADATPLVLEALAGLPADMLAEARIEPHPSAALLGSEWPVGSIWAAHQEAEVRPLGHSLSEAVLVVRPDAQVRVHILPAKDVAFVEALFSGAQLGDAAEAALTADPAFEFGTALVGLVGLGAFASIVPAGHGAALT